MKIEVEILLYVQNDMEIPRRPNGLARDDADDCCPF